MGQRKRSIAAPMRAFNRFYTERIGALADRHEGLDITLAESRTLFTIDRLGAPDLGMIADALALDLGYVSRLISRLERKGLVSREVDNGDRRRRLIRLTRAGAALLSEVARRSDARMDALTEHLSSAQRRELLRAMDTVRDILDQPERKRDGR